MNMEATGSLALLPHDKERTLLETRQRGRPRGFLSGSLIRKMRR